MDILPLRYSAVYANAAVRISEEERILLVSREINEIRSSPKITEVPFGQISARHFNRRKCCQLGMFRSTDSRHQFITLNVQLCTMVVLRVARGRRRKLRFQTT